MSTRIKRVSGLPLPDTAHLQCINALDLATLVRPSGSGEAEE